MARLSSERSQSEFSAILFDSQECDGHILKVKGPKKKGKEKMKDLQENGIVSPCSEKCIVE